MPIYYFLWCQYQLPLNWGIIIYVPEVSLRSGVHINGSEYYYKKGHKYVIPVSGNVIIGHTNALLSDVTLI